MQRVSQLACRECSGCQGGWPGLLCSLCWFCCCQGTEAALGFVGYPAPAERKDAVLVELLWPHGRSVADVAKEDGMSVASPV